MYVVLVMGVVGMGLFVVLLLVLVVCGGLCLLLVFVVDIGLDGVLWVELLLVVCMFSELCFFVDVFNVVFVWL